MITEAVYCFSCNQLPNSSPNWEIARFLPSLPCARGEAANMDHTASGLLQYWEYIPWLLQTLIVYLQRDVNWARLLAYLFGKSRKRFESNALKVPSLIKVSFHISSFTSWAILVQCNQCQMQSRLDIPYRIRYEIVWVNSGGFNASLLIEDNRIHGFVFLKPK